MIEAIYYFENVKVKVNYSSYQSMRRTENYIFAEIPKDKTHVRQISVSKPYDSKNISLETRIS